VSAPTARDADDSPFAGLLSFSRDLWINHKARNDISVGLGAWRVWSTLGWHDIRQRYRRSVLGPFWFTLTTLIMVAVLGMLYSILLKQDISVYLPYLGVGLVVWQFISTTANEGCATLISSSHMMRQMRVPVSSYIARMVWRNVIILLHSLPVVVILLVVLGNKLHFSAVLAIPGLVLLALNMVWFCIIIAVLCARYRDIAPIVGNIFQVGFFLTPVMWQIEALDGRDWVANWNPFYHMIEIIRAPLTTGDFPLLSWVVSLALLVAGFAAAQYLMVRARGRITYWI
jgi:ABC-type polysaccharide/polyol phosphate export permease